MPKKRVDSDDEDTKSVTDMQTARGRLKGILEEIAGQSDDEGGSGSPKKRKLGKKETAKVPQVQHSYVMKLFDRSVDLARFNDTTPLYPICRAWIRGSGLQKKNRGYASKKNRQYYEHKVDLLQIIKDDKHKEVMIDLLPPPEKKAISRVPNLLPCQENLDKDSVNVDYDIDNPPMTREQILEEMKPRWKKVKQNWIDQINKVETRYKKSLDILDALYQTPHVDE
ncbi:uncharacterized protein DMENIID0001_097540 [Sergentomyia squamirostris]